MIEKIQEIFKDVFDNEELLVEEKTTSEDIEEWDSMAQIDIVVALENEFQIKFTIEEVQKLTSIKSMMSTLSKKLGH